MITVRPAKLEVWWVVVAGAILYITAIVAVSFGAVDLDIGRVAASIVDRLFFVEIDTGFTAQQEACLLYTSPSPRDS